MTHPSDVADDRPIDDPDAGGHPADDRSVAPADVSADVSADASASDPAIETAIETGEADPSGADPAEADAPDPVNGFAALGLHRSIVDNLEAGGLEAPWPIQESAIPPALAGRDVIGLAPTGRGKTIAFLAPMADRLLRDTIERSPRGAKRRRGHLPAAERLRGLVICPTRELAQQVAEVAETLLRGTRHSAVCAYGKVAVNPQLAAIREGCDILVGTPGRLRELIEEHGISLAHVRSVAIDEVDRMLDMGFLPQVSRILERLSPERTSGVFTATMPKAVRELTEQFLRRPILSEAGRHTHAAAHVTQHLIEIANHDKVDLLLRLFELGHGKGTLVFCGTRRRVGWVATALERNGIRAGMLHGDRSQARRDAALAGFRSGDLDVLVCTDVAARGLHVDRVRTVINYDVPNGVEEFVHRIGRAGHGGGTGEAFTFLCGRDAEKWDRIEWNVVDPVPLMEVPGWTPSEPRRRSDDPRGGDGRPGRPAESRGRSGGGRSGGGRPGGPRAGQGGGGRGAGGRSEHPGRRRDAEGGTGSRGGRPGGKPASRRATRPIPKNQKPGGGVRRPPSSD